MYKKMLDHCMYQMKLKANIHDFVPNFLYMKIVLFTLASLMGHFGQ